MARHEVAYSTVLQLFGVNELEVIDSPKIEIDAIAQSQPQGNQINIVHDMSMIRSMVSLTSLTLIVIPAVFVILEGARLGADRTRGELDPTTSSA